MTCPPNIGPDEILDNIHSLYVDQWDWERAISRKERNLHFLKSIVRKIYGGLRATEHFLHFHYPVIKPGLPEDIYFIHTEELEKRFPNLRPNEREDSICRLYGTVFLLGIGAPLKNGSKHRI